MKWMYSILCVALIATASINTVRSCDVIDWVECAGIVALCAVPCIDPLDGICEVCMGVAYSKCVSCITLTNEINDLVTLKGSSNQTCDAASWVKCAAQLGKCEVVCEGDLTDVACISCLGRTADECVYCLPQVAKRSLDLEAKQAKCSPWTWVQCAAKVIDCAATCANDFKSHACTKCFGHTYDQCVGCIGFEKSVQSRRPQDLSLFDCSASNWLWCAGSLAKCSYECLDKGITSPECFNCLGTAYDDCMKCISSDGKAELKHLAIAQAIKRGSFKARSVGSSTGNCHHEHYKAEGSKKK